MVTVVECSERLIRIRTSGEMTIGVAAELIDVLDQFIGTRTSGLQAFNDVSEVTLFHPAAREKMNAWASAHIEPFVAVQIRVGSRPMAWTIRMLAALLGQKIVAHHSAESFEAAWQKACRS